MHNWDKPYGLENARKRERADTVKLIALASVIGLAIGLAIALPIFYALCGVA